MEKKKSIFIKFIHFHASLPADKSLPFFLSNFLIEGEKLENMKRLRQD